MMKKWHIAALLLAVALLSAGVGAYAATNYGSQSDPLVAMSYLDEVLAPQLEREFSAALDEAAGSLTAANGAFVSASLSGSGVRCEAGTEIISLSAGAGADGALIDATTGETLAAGGELQANHLYLAAEALTLYAQGEVLLRGSYSL